jgi:pimeloyl-ACP methyl ester carboxylesterase
MPPPILRHKVGDVSVRMMRAGKGSPVLFLHGAGGFPIWGPFFDKLAAQHEVIVPEHPGFGDSDNPSFIRNVGDMAMYYLDFLEALGVGKVHIAGHSLGGWICAEVAVRNCSNLASLTLIAPAGVRIKGLPCGDNFIWSLEESARNLFFNQKFADAMLALTPSEEDMDRALANRFMAARLGWEPRWFNPALERWLHRVQVPTQIMWGAQDKLFPADYAKAWAKSIAGAKVEIIPECGHIPTVEKADVAAGTILSFLAGR